MLTIKDVRAAELLIVSRQNNRSNEKRAFRLQQYALDTAAYRIALAIPDLFNNVTLVQNDCTTSQQDAWNH